MLMGTFLRRGEFLKLIQSRDKISCYLMLLYQSMRNFARNKIRRFRQVCVNLDDGGYILFLIFFSGGRARWEHCSAQVSHSPRRRCHFGCRLPYSCETPSRALKPPAFCDIITTELALFISCRVHRLRALLFCNLRQMSAIWSKTWSYDSLIVYTFSEFKSKVLDNRER